MPGLAREADAMSDGSQIGKTTQFVLIAAKQEAAYWKPNTVARAICLHDLLPSPSEETLAAFRDEVLRSLVGRAAEKFWASDAVTPAKAAAIRSACRALHDLTIDVLVETAAETSPEATAEPSPRATGRTSK